MEPILFPVDAARFGRRKEQWKMTKKNANAWMKPARALLLALLLSALLGAPASAAAAHPVDPPTISRAGGRYLGSQTVVITCRPGWYVSYTTDGSAPIQMWLSDDAYVQPANPTGSSSVTLDISQSFVLRAAAYRPKTDKICEYSGEAAQSYVIYEENHAPTFTPEGGNVDDPVAHITISCEEGWQIAYAIEDGSMAGTAELITYEHGMYRPAVSSIYYPIFHAGSSVTLKLPTDPATSVKAIAYQKTADGQYRFSTIVKQMYRYKIPERQWAASQTEAPAPPGQTEAPAPPRVHVNSDDFVLEEGYTQAIGLRIRINNSKKTNVLQGAEIAHGDTDRFYLDKTPGKIILEPSQPVGVYCTIYPYLGLAAGEHQGTLNLYYNDAVMPINFVLNVTTAKPIFSLAPGTYVGPQQVSLFTTTQDATIMYTTDGRDPVVYGNPYTGPITVSESTTIKAYAYLSSSPTQSRYFSVPAEAAYTIIPPSYTLELTAPQFDEAAAGYAQPEPKPLAFVSAGNSDATITSVGFLEGGDAFILNKTDGATIAAGSTDDTTYTVQPAAGLEPGTYRAIVAAAYDGGETAAAELSFTVNEPLYSITVYVNEDDRDLGGVTILGPDQARAGSRVNFMAWMNNDYYDEYQLTDVVVSDMSGNPIEVDYWGGFVMPASHVTLTPVFEPLLPIAIELGDAVDLMGIQTESHAWGWDNAKAAAGETVTMEPMLCTDEYALASVTVTAEDGSRVPCARYSEYLADVDFTETGWRFVMPDMPVTVQFALVPVFGGADFVLPANLAIIEANAFQGDGLISAVDAGHCAVIGAEAFKNCVNLSQIRLSYFCQIDPSAFDGCGTVYVFAPSGGQTEAACAAIGNCVFVAE